MKIKVEEANLTLGDFENSIRKLAAENGDLLRQVGELENNLNLLAKAKSQLLYQLDEAKKNADDEARERMSLSGKFKNLEHELDGLKDQFEEEVCARDDLLRQVSRASLEADMWIQRYE